MTFAAAARLAATLAAAATAAPLPPLLVKVSDLKNEKKKLFFTKITKYSIGTPPDPVPVRVDAGAVRGGRLRPPRRELLPGDGGGGGGGPAVGEGGRLGASVGGGGGGLEEERERKIEQLFFTNRKV